MVAAPAVSAWAALGAARLLGVRARTAFLVGFLYGFSTYQLAHTETATSTSASRSFRHCHRPALQGHRRLVSSRRGGLLIGVATLLSRASVRRYSPPQAF